MISGTNVAEITESLAEGELIRVIGTGWQPRSYSFEVYTQSGCIKIKGKESIDQLRELLERFIVLDKKVDK